MARITVEDCLGHVANRFHLVTLATKRARQLSLFGAEPLLERENDKDTVIALREIAAGLITDAVFDDANEDIADEVTRVTRLDEGDETPSDF